jgi:long-chain fatty acid transport protein
MSRHRKFKAALLTGSAGLAIALGTTAAEAGGFAVREQSAYFQGSSFAAAAAGGPSISSMFWNPATMTQAAPGLTTESNYTGFFGRTNITPSAATGAFPGLLGRGSSGDIAEDALIPASYTVWKATDRLAFGFALTSPFGLVTAPHNDWAGMFYSRLSRVFTINAMPSVAYQLNDWISVGVGLQVQYMKVKLDSAFPGSSIPPTLPDSLSIRGDSVDFGFTAGVTLTPTPWTTIGIGYRSQIDQRLDGQIERPAFLFPVGAGFVTIPGTIMTANPTVPLPDSINVGVRQRISPAFTLLGTFEWTNWSRLQNIDTRVVGPLAPGIPAVLPFPWRDGYFGSVGREYQWSPLLALRTGIGFEQSPITDRVRGTRLPDADRVWLSAGLTYNWSERLSIEFGYSHVFVKEARINIGPGNPLFDLTTPPGALGTFAGTARTDVDIISAALRWRWGEFPPRVLAVKG